MGTQENVLTLLLYLLQLPHLHLLLLHLLLPHLALLHYRVEIYAWTQMLQHNLMVHAARSTTPAKKHLALKGQAFAVGRICPTMQLVGQMTRAMAPVWLASCVRLQVEKQWELAQHPQTPPPAWLPE